MFGASLKFGFASFFFKTFYTRNRRKLVENERYTYSPRARMRTPTSSYKYYTGTISY